MAHGKAEVFWFSSASIAFALVSVFLFWHFVYAFPDPNPGISASTVLGQTTFTGSTANAGGISTSTLSYPTRAFSDGEKLYVADSSNHRVLIWNTSTPSTGAAADIILGQATATANSANRGGSVSSSTLNSPESVYADTSKIYVADYSNHRVLIWNTKSPVTGQGADIVLGQEDFTSNSSNKGSTPSQDSLNRPYDVASNGSYVVVADRSNHRIMIWNSLVTGDNALRVIGQANFTATSSNRGGSPADTTVSDPRGVSIDTNSKIYIADSGNHRVLIFNTFPPVNGDPASIVLGQDNFTSNSADKGGSMSTSTFSTPIGIFATSTNLFVADQGNGRVLVWDTTSAPANGSDAQFVIGKGVYNQAGGYDVSATSLSYPEGISYVNSRAYVADANNNRVLIFSLAVATSAAPNMSSISTSTVSFTVGTSTNHGIAQYTIFDNTELSFVAADRSISESSALWRTTSTWNNPLTISGFVPGKTYSMRTRGRYISGLEAASSTATSLTMLPNIAGTPTVVVASTSSIQFSVSANSNYTSVTYAVFSSTTNQYVSASGTATTTAIFQATSTWTTTTFSGLFPNTGYSLAAIAKNSGDALAATSTGSSLVYTYANPSGTPTVTASSTSALSITIDVNNNSTSTQYAIYNVTSGNYISATGTVSSLPIFQTTSTWSSVGIQELSVNTGYQFTVIARNEASITAATSTTSTAAYTLANTPSAVSVSAGSGSITISWTGDASQYYVENSTAGSNSGWISASQTSFTGLSCGTTYTFRVKGKNGGGTETAYASSVSATTSGCGGGFVPAPVSLPPNALLINAGAKETNNALVQLSIQATDVKDIAISNMADFVGSSFVPYKTSIPWTLSPGGGQKTVYVRFKAKSGSISTISQTIVLNIPSLESPPTKNDTQITTSTGKVSTCPLEPGKAYKLRLTPDIWLVTSACTRRPFKNPEAYFSYFSSWKDFLIVSKEQFAVVPPDINGDLPLGPLYKPDHGTFIRVPSDPTIYYVLGKKKIILGSEKVFTDLGYKKDWIVFADRGLLDKYELLKTVTSTINHLDLTLVKYPSSPKIYILEYGKKRHITDEKALFHNKLFRFDRVIDIHDTEGYPDGEQIKA